MICSGVLSRGWRLQKKIQIDKMQRFYFDTSVFGGAFDKELEEDTMQLFERVKSGQVICVFSDLTETELLNAPEC